MRQYSKYKKFIDVRSRENKTDNELDYIEK